MPEYQSRPHRQDHFECQAQPIYATIIPVPQRLSDEQGVALRELVRPDPAAIDRGQKAPVFKQVYDALRVAIMAGQLAPGNRLPSTRDLALRYGIARSWVVAVYEQMLAEGLIVSRVGDGTFVARDLLEGAERSQTTKSAQKAPSSERSMPVSRYAALRPDQQQFETAPFSLGRSDLDDRSIQIWRGLTLRALKKFDPAILGYSDPRGSFRLREIIAAYLRSSRAVSGEPGQVFILAGVQHGLDLVTRVVVEPGTPIWVEDPAYTPAYAAFAAANARIVPVPVDDQGMVVGQGIAAEPAAKAVFVTPSNQFPLGSVMSMPRRAELLAWAQEANSWIIEDDYDSEFRYEGRPLASLQGMDAFGRVIYLGSFSKVVFPGLRLGYAVVPHQLLDAMMAARYLSDRQPAGLLEPVVADYIEEGHFAAHIRRMRKRYRASRDKLVDALRLSVGTAANVLAPDQGMHLLLRLREGVDDREIAKLAAAAGIVARPLSRFFIAAKPISGLLLGFTGHSSMSLNTGAELLGRVIQTQSALVDKMHAPLLLDPARQVARSRLTSIDQAPFSTLQQLCQRSHQQASLLIS